MSEFKLKPMPEIFLLDKVTGKLPKNYKEILAQMHKKNSPKIENDVPKEEKEFKLKPMPELEFLDRVTGKFPKNVSELVKAKKDRFTKNDNSKENTKEVANESELKLRPMPEIFLIDPITGELPKNYKDILSQRSNAGSSSSFVNNYKNEVQNSKDARQKLNNCEFKITNVKPNIFKKVIPDSTGHTNAKSKIVRKALFPCPGPSRSTLTRSRFSQYRKISNIQVDDTLPLLDIEESESELLMGKKPTATFKRSLPKPVQVPTQKKLQSKKKRWSTSSGCSMDEFLKLEQQCKTPKSIIKRARQGSSDGSKYVNITNKIGEIRRLYKEIEDKTSEIKDKYNKIEQNWNEILHDLKFAEEVLSEQTNSNLTEVKENLQFTQDLQSLPNAKKVNLRITTLQKNLQRKVLFNLNNNETAVSPVVTKRSRPVLKAAETPNTMIRALSKTIDEQYKLLQDTPKSKQSKS